MSPVPSECSASDFLVAPDGRSITFLPCGVTSHNANDVRERYCARCHRFMELNEASLESMLVEMAQTSQEMGEYGGDNPNAVGDL